LPPLTYIDCDRAGPVGEIYRKFPSQIGTRPILPVASITNARDRKEDGTVYAGISPDTGKPMYTTAVDAPLTVKWKEAMRYVDTLKAYGYKDWRVPTKAELNVLFNNRTAIGGFYESNEPSGHYWSSTPIDRYAAGLSGSAMGFS
jgi:hypothetical protein